MPAENQESTSFKDLLARLPKVTGAISAALAALLPILLPDRLVPYQLDALKPILSIVLIIGFLWAWGYQSKLRGRLGKFLLLAAGGIGLTLLIQIVVVVQVDNYGDPPATYYFLVGTSLTDQGREMLDRVGAADLSRAEQIRRAGDGNIPVLYGWTYRAMAVLASLGLIATALGIVLSLAAAEIDRQSRPRASPARVP